MKRSILLAIALSPFLLNAELREDLYDPSFEEEEVEEMDYVAEEDEMSEDLLYGEEDYIADAQMQENPQDDVCHSPYHAMHVGARHTEARGVGYRDGYTTIEGFGIDNNNMYFMPFLDLRGHVFNNGKLAGNVGVGGRSVIPSINHIFGFYLYYDVRQENHDLTVNQLSPGIELLGSRMEYRVNGYFHVGNAHSHKYGFKFDRFSGHHILLKNKQKRAMLGGDAEIGAHITQSTQYDLYAGAGPYYFTTQDHRAWGGKVRLLGRYKEYIALEASYSYDHLFRNIVQGTVAFNYPFGRKLKRRGERCPQKNDLTLSRAAFAPYRFEIPVVKRVHQRRKAINPATHKPWQVWFVNNTSSSQGTFASPFPTLLQAQAASSPNDMIYVFPGDGTTTGMDSGITLQDGQVLFGSAISHKIRTTRGKITIPSFSSNFPTLTNSPIGGVVTLANNNEVSGLQLISPLFGEGIVSLSTGITNATISKNLILCTGNDNGIEIFASGTVRIFDNMIVAQTLNSSDGIAVQMTGPLRLNIYQNSISGFDFDVVVNGGAFSNSLSTVKIQRNLLADFTDQGVIVNALFQGTTVISENAVNNTRGGAGGSIGIYSSNVVNPIIQNNAVTTSPAITGSVGIKVDARILPSTCTALVANNLITTGDATSIGLYYITATSNICTSISNNLVTSPIPATAFRFESSGTGRIRIDRFENNIGSGVLVVPGTGVDLVAPGTCISQ